MQSLKRNRPYLVIGIAALMVIIALSAVMSIRLKPNKNPISSTSAVHISSISPSSGPVNTNFAITGSGFTDNNYIEIAGGYYPVGASSSSGTIIRFTLPSQFADSSGCYGPPFSKAQSSIHCDAIREVQIYPGTYPIDVLTNHGKSNQISFTVSQ